MTTRRQIPNPSKRIKPTPNLSVRLSDAAHISLTDLASYVSAVVLTFFGLLFSVSGGDVVGPASTWILALLIVSGLVIAYLSIRVGSRVLALRNAGRNAQTGARLHLRFVMLFAANGVIPVVLIALFSALTIRQGVQAWFSDQVREAVQATRVLGNQSVDKTAEATKIDIAAMAVDLNASAIQLKADPKAYRNYLATQADRRGFVAAYVLNAQGEKLAQAQRPQGVPEFIMPDKGDFAIAQAGDVSINIDPSAVVRALYRLDAFSNSYLAVVRLPEPGQLALFEKAKAAIYAYQLIEDRQGILLFLFGLAYLEIVLLVLIGSVWLGLLSAGRISTPIGLLADAAERVRAGDMSARVAQVGGGDEISALATTFNKMTGELQFQRRALEEAAEYAETRSAFIRAVLEGVSAGVVSLDKSHIIRAANGSSGRLLQPKDERLEGQDFSQIAPEFMAIVGSARPNHPAQGQAERLVGAETLLFDVRAAYAGDDLVVTFDDVSGLLAAQRQAAWKDVARRIAHEIKNPLTPIQLSAERLKRKYAEIITTDRDVFIRMTDTIVRQVTDIGRMVDEFSSYARMPSPKFAVDDLSEALRQAIFAQRIANPDIEIITMLPPEPVMVSMDTRLLIQAFTNIIKNAAEGIAARRTRDGTDLKGLIEVHLSLDPKTAWIEISDNGVGFPSQDRRRLMEPYMTTRAKGTGLGLAIVARVLEEHGGALELSDRANHEMGALVRMNLPIHNHASALQNESKFKKEKQSIDLECSDGI
ncbi:sensor histidine kinase NtrY-like [Candidatus Phycosocius spiralis]|uniref:histidine kinase n=1 Tax=Candidatus Phycosocius spiralis TaxID=2815099 RepID=A0ABQ4PSK3_9PROT|nr:PAS domain-containing sensor histidine kinase [Candidatus Phycosocius spiralis]GIU65970.1 PAS domain-containing sensor histidine kinase [Candidatus Phycosocius spiralis]